MRALLPFLRLFTTITVVLLATVQLGFAADFSRVRPERAGMSSERLDRLDTVLKSYVENEQLAGQVAMVLRKGRVVFSAANGWQDKAAGIPMSEDSIFRIASQTKALISTGIMILHERGQLDISHPLSRYIPEWENMKVAVSEADGNYRLEDARRPITIRHLLTHTGGVSYGSGPARDQWQQAGFQGWYFADRTEPVLESIKRMAALPLDQHPGEEYIYGYNTDILGAVIEVASGKDLNTFMTEELFERLAMTDTHFFLPEDKAARLAVVYEPAPGGGVRAIDSSDGMQSQGLYVQGSGPNISFSGGAGLVSTANDYARFLQMTLNGGEQYNCDSGEQA